MNHKPLKTGPLSTFNNVCQKLAERLGFEPRIRV